MSHDWIVEVISYKDGSREHAVGPFATEAQADKADRGLNINLNHDQFYTIVRQAEKKNTRRALVRRPG